MTTRQVSAHGLAFLRHAEGEPGTGKPALIAYQDPAGVWTIGFGHTAGVTRGMTCTAAQADAWFDADLDDPERAVATLVTVPLNDNQFDALVSFAFNCGVEAFRTSTLLRMLNHGDYDAVPGQLARWVNVTRGGAKVRSAGLVNRRAAETALWLLPADEPAQAPAVPTEQPTADVPAMSPTPATVTTLKVQPPQVVTAEPVAPPRKVSHAPGGKTGITALIAGAGGLVTEGYRQVQPTIEAARQVADGIGHGPAWVRLVGAVLVLVSIGALAYSLWRRRRELQAGR